jgi:hypothetical protein
MKKTKDVANDEDLKHLSPRSREIASVMKFVQKSFND